MRLALRSDTQVIFYFLVLVRTSLISFSAITSGTDSALSRYLITRSTCDLSPRCPLFAIDPLLWRTLYWEVSIHELLSLWSDFLQPERDRNLGRDHGRVKGLKWCEHDDCLSDKDLQ